MKNTKVNNKINKEKSNEQEISFFKFLFQKPQLLDFAIILAGCLLAYIVVRYCYPYPLTISDSGGYIDAAIRDTFYVYRPFGYSYFLQLLHSITTNIHFIFIIQLFLLFLATCFLAFTIKYFFPATKKWLWYISLLFLLFTPTSFIMANWIMSDLLFSVQIYFIISLFIFIIKRKSWIAALLFALCLFTTLHVRYSAIVIPFVFIPFFLMKKGNIRWVLTLLSVFVFCIYYSQVKKNMKELVRIDQFSTGFDGWIYANNVFYTLPHINIKNEDFKKQRLTNLHNFIMQDIDTIGKIINNETKLGAKFMWDNNLPLKQHLFKTMQAQRASYLTTFVKLGSGIYKEYAIHIMTHYPFSYLRYYYLPNCKQTFYPAPGCIENAELIKPQVLYEYYNMDEENTMQAKHDFLNPTFHYHSTMKIIHLVVWIVIAGIGIVSIVKRKKLTFSRDDKIIFWGSFCFAVIYYASSIFAAPMEIRYCIGMHSIQFIFSYLLLNKLFINSQSL